MSKIEITKNENFIGEWFLPPNDFKSAKQISGTLTWTNRRALLELHDCFTLMDGDIYGDEANTYPVVHGTTINSNLITMLEASGTGNSVSFGHGGARQTERLRSSIIVVGDHVTGSTTYNEMRVRIPGLETWLNRGGIELQLIHQTSNKPTAAIYQIEYMPVEEFSIPAIDATIDFSVNRSFSTGTNNVQVTTYGTVQIKPSSPQNLEWYFEQLGKICTLLGFIAGTPMGPDKIEVKRDKTSNPIDVLVALRQDKHCTMEDIHNFFLLRSTLDTTEFGDILSKWFSIYESVETPSQLAQSVLVSDDLWLHVEFLSLMQALEGFHRATSDGFYLSTEEYEPIKQAILTSFPSNLNKSHRSSLKSRIEYGNEISLSKRLNDLANRLPEGIRRRLFGLDGKVPRSWIDTRNYYTHWDEMSRSNVLDGVDMHRTSVRLRLLLRVLYLDLVGIASSAIAKALDGSNKESQHLIQLNNNEIRKAYPNAKVKPLMSISMKDASAPDETLN